MSDWRMRLVSDSGSTLTDFDTKYSIYGKLGILKNIQIVMEDIARLKDEDLQYCLEFSMNHVNWFRELMDEHLHTRPDGWGGDYKIECCRILHTGRELALSFLVWEARQRGLDLVKRAPYTRLGIVSGNLAAAKIVAKLSDTDLKMHLRNEIQARISFLDKVNDLIHKGSQDASPGIDQILAQPEREARLNLLMWEARSRIIKEQI